MVSSGIYRIPPGVLEGHPVVPDDIEEGRDIVFVREEGGASSLIIPLRGGRVNFLWGEGYLTKYEEEPGVNGSVNTCEYQIGSTLLDGARRLCEEYLKGM